MIVDSSAIIAILRDEPAAAAMAEALQEAPIRRISAVTYVEAAIVADSSETSRPVYEASGAFARRASITGTRRAISVAASIG